MKIAFIGGGNMGEAILSAVLANGLATATDITVSDIAEAKREALAKKYGVKTTSSNPEAIKGAEVVILAVKPQTLLTVMPELVGKLGANELVISIIAGVQLKKLREGLKHNRIVRVMPNTPAQVGEGMSVWTATPEVTEKQIDIARSVFGVTGKEIHVADEDLIDMATAVSGSGPAYFFLFIEALTEAGFKLGLNREIAEDLAIQTIIGSARLIQQSDRSPGELRQMVTSPGGTTTAALAEFDRGGLNELVTRAVRAAYSRAKELGQQ